MEKKEKQISLILILIFLTYIITMFPFMVLLQSPEYANSIVPISGLPQSTHYALFIFIIPYLLALLLLLILPIIIVPLFSKGKKLIFRNFENGYIPINLEEISIDFKQYVKRAIFVALLAIGLLATLAPIINLDLFVAERQMEYLNERGIPVQYSMDGFLAVLLLIFPFSLGLWAIGWAMEDLGLIHYRLPDEETPTLFEIEPMHLKYTQIIKGYAGISAIVYYIGILIWYVTNPGAGQITDIIFTFMTIFLWILLSFPYYFLYRTVLLNRLKFLRKGMPECRTITKSEFQSK